MADEVANDVPRTDAMQGTGQIVQNHATPMMRPLPAAACCLVLSALVLAQQGPESVARGTGRFAKTVVTSGLSSPWELAWGPDGMLWATERSGKRVTRVDPATGERRVAVTIEEAAAPGGQQGVLGMALHPELLQGTGNDVVYVAYTYVDRGRDPDPRVTDPDSPHRFLYSKIVRLRYDAPSGTLSDPVDIIAGLPASNDHNGMRLAIARDGRLHLTIGDMGNNQFGNFCYPIEAQRLPTRDDIAKRDYSAYVGKTLRIDPDGGIPADNPELAGVVSHVFTYGHRNPQGITVGPDGTVYSSEHGPKTDDEVNVLVGGGNYGWPHVAGFRDDSAYAYRRWENATTPCQQLQFSDLVVPDSVPRELESAYRGPLVEPIATLFTVPTGFNFADPACRGSHSLCWPTVAASSIELYAGRADGIPGWDPSLIVSTLKRGSLYVVPLDAARRRAAGPVMRYLQSENRYRDTAVHPDGRTIYVATDISGLADSLAGGPTSDLEDRGAILAFTYLGDGDDASAGADLASARTASPAPSEPAFDGPGVPPTFTRAQASAGKAAYDTHCAMCHGTTLINSTFGTPLAGEYFRAKWGGRSVATLFEKSRGTMPPAAPASLSRESYAAILAYILEVNGLASGDVSLPADAAGLTPMRIP